ncbi:hypothetical protein MSAN_00574800 [Mycena sanguinolenta]|uniref:Uncharacterized protein n=1 Tax=Mycena sanguinolenta TaxID=230812 RepID=A0A8H6ZA55_9AGAR|nr:hypothetical protein MSAN_00574800 [Mycena sanguinolenta]
MSSMPLHSSPERMRRGESGSTSRSALNRVPEDNESLSESEWELEEELLLEEQGFYKGSYKRLVAFYTLAPLTALAAFALLAILPYVAYRWPKPNPPAYPYPAFLPFPLLEILASVALYSLTHILRNPVYTFSAALVSLPLPATLLSTILQTVLSILARLFTLALLLVHRYALYAYPTWEDSAFRRVWWAALRVGRRRGRGIALYRDVLVTPSAPASDPERTPLLPPRRAAPDPDAEIDQDLEQLVALKAREELEDVFGLPLIRIPAFIPCLQRVNSLLLSIGLFLLLGAAQFSTSLRWALVVLATAMHLLLAVLHAPIVLPRIGVQSAAYVGAVVSLGVFFTGLAVWDGVS